MQVRAAHAAAVQRQRDQALASGAMVRLCIPYVICLQTLSPAADPACCPAPASARTALTAFRQTALAMLGIALLPCAEASCCSLAFGIALQHRVRLLGASEV